MVIIVPPVGGPDSGEILVMVGLGQLVKSVIGESLHWSSTSQVAGLPHQAQSKPVSVLAARQTEQESPRPPQSYSKAGREGRRHEDA